MQACEKSMLESKYDRGRQWINIEFDTITIGSYFDTDAEVETLRLLSLVIDIHL